MNKIKKVWCLEKADNLKINKKWHFKRQKIKIVNANKYLGITLWTKLWFAKHFRQKYMSTKFSLNSIGKQIPLFVKFTIIVYSIIRPLLTYG